MHILIFIIVFFFFFENKSNAIVHNFSTCVRSALSAVFALVSLCRVPFLMVSKHYFLPKFDMKKSPGLSNIIILIAIFLYFEKENEVGNICAPGCWVFRMGRMRKAKHCESGAPDQVARCSLHSCIAA